MLRKMNGYSQEQIAEKIGISRQAYAKWENGMTIPDIEKAALLAQVWGQIVIPKAARDHLGFNGGDRLIVLSDEVGIALLPADYFESKIRELKDLIAEKL